jgi:hypothetical protein
MFDLIALGAFSCVYLALQVLSVGVDPLRTDGLELRLAGSRLASQRYRVHSWNFSNHRNH